jgi:hypothetical protein
MGAIKTLKQQLAENRLAKTGWQEWFEGIFERARP